MSYNPMYTIVFFWLCLSGMCFSAQVSVNLLNGLYGSNGFNIYGASSGSQTGRTISSGDINGDNIPDVAFGVYTASSTNKPQTGSTFVVFGKSTNFPLGIELSNLNGRNGFRINGASSYEGSGFSISLGGDINKDGIGDMIIGAFGASPNGRTFSGSTYVLFGKTGSFDRVVELSLLDGTNGFKINGENAYDYSGCSVNSEGDINGDNINDILIGAKTASPGGRISAGKSYIVFGKSSGFASSLELSSLNGINGFSMNGAFARDNVGQSVSLGSDVNGDGISDILVGANSRRGGYIVFGQTSPFPPTLELSTLNGINGFALVTPMPTMQPSSDNPGLTFDHGRDINGDGIGDIIIGSYHSSPNDIYNAGTVYVVFGRTTFSQEVILSALNGLDGFIIYGNTVNQNLGFSVKIGEDINGDRIGDFVIGSIGASPNGNRYSGATYVFYGKSSGYGAVVSTILDGNNGFTLNGGSIGDNSGSSITLADINGDGLSDVIVGSMNASPSRRIQAGAGYVVFGTP
eukprot:TRINITY_DN242_c0_g1_i15.p1 TRINITY_DN242_c0_g1~~TRINITY_DN242_c0_g1_i15.p1  ORF type:complete len:519 (+),score=89.26 TRINITY_DN242_c0_g1_i15:76-1632(+)